MNNTTMQNFMYILIEQCKIFGITFLVSIPFALIFFPLSIVVWSIGGIVGWIALFIAGFKIMQGIPLDTPMNTPAEGKLTAEEWVDMKKAQDTYNDERKAKRNEDLKASADKVVTVATPIVKYVLRIAKLTAITLVSLFVVGSVVAFAMHIIPQL